MTPGKLRSRLLSRCHEPACRAYPKLVEPAYKHVVAIAPRPQSDTLSVEHTASQGVAGVIGWRAAALSRVAPSWSPEGLTAVHPHRKPTRFYS
jgi:hypothetical protein